MVVISDNSIRVSSGDQNIQEDCRGWGVGSSQSVQVGKNRDSGIKVRC